jgi:ADP-ribose pyrophosphatase YjhB (NUDIX family)
MKGPRVIVRAIIVEDGKLLVNRHQGYFALFGGGVEKGESAREALLRELEEELNLRVAVEQLVYVIENRYRKKHELGLYYRARRLTTQMIVHEPHLEPTWISLAEVADSALLPTALRNALQRGIPEHPIEVL